MHITLPVYAFIRAYKAIDFRYSYTVAMYLAFLLVAGCTRLTAMTRVVVAEPVLRKCCHVRLIGPCGRIRLAPAAGWK